MQKMMQKMGMQQTEVDATEVIIRTPQKEFIFSRPTVSRINVMGQDTWQVVGVAEEKERIGISKEDIEMVRVQCDVDEGVALNALKECEGDIAKAILKLKT
jgi:nascent polypeptide-associated complex subunit alpha